MWERPDLPEIRGPVRGFTWPRGDEFFVLTPGGLVRVRLDPVEVQTVADAATLATLYGPGDPGLLWDGRRQLVYDADGGDITPCDHPNGDRIVMDRDGTLKITDPTERELRQRIATIRLPTDDGWMFAGFSHDYRWLIAGAPGAGIPLCAVGVRRSDA